MLVNVAAFYETEDERVRRAAWLREIARALQPEDDAAYVGFLSGDGEARIRGAYLAATWDRLTRIETGVRSDERVPAESERSAGEMTPSALRSRRRRSSAGSAGALSRFARAGEPSQNARRGRVPMKNKTR